MSIKAIDNINAANTVLKDFYESLDKNKIQNQKVTTIFKTMQQIHSQLAEAKLSDPSNFTGALKSDNCSKFLLLRQDIIDFIGQNKTEITSPLLHQVELIHSLISPECHDAQPGHTHVNYISTPEELAKFLHVSLIRLGVSMKAFEAELQEQPVHSHDLYRTYPKKARAEQFFYKGNELRRHAESTLRTMKKPEFSSFAEKLNPSAPNSIGAQIRNLYNGLSSICNTWENLPILKRTVISGIPEMNRLLRSIEQPLQELSHLQDPPFEEEGPHALTMKEHYSAVKAAIRKKKADISSGIQNMAIAAKTSAATAGQLLVDKVGALVHRHHEPHGESLLHKDESSELNL